MLEAFNNWEKLVRGEIEHVSSLLGESLSDEAARLIVEISEVESCYARLGFLLAKANSFLDQASYSFLPDRELKELDRKLELNSKTAPIKEVRDYIKVLLNGIEQRISLAQSILRTHIMTQEASLRIRS